eukprot:scaffold2763_cov161-Pinguiococcus_pyrenoidosus.AAC.2
MGCLESTKAPTDESIRMVHRALLRKCHPDHSLDVPEAADDMTKRVYEQEASLSLGSGSSGISDLARLTSRPLGPSELQCREASTPSCSRSAYPRSPQ